MSISIQVIIYTYIQCLYSLKPRCFTALLFHKVESQWEFIFKWFSTILFLSWNCETPSKNTTRTLLFQLFDIVNIFLTSFIIISLWFMFEKTNAHQFKRRAFSISTQPLYVKLYCCIDSASLLFFPGMLPNVIFFCCICFKI